SLRMTEPWYQAGLRFRCTRCGDCCTGEPGNVWVNAEEIAAIAKVRDETVEEVTARFTAIGHRGRTLREKGNGECVFYERGKGCTVYRVRPRQCRTWPFWASNLATPEDWERTKSVCPGSGHGELISSDEITRRMNVIRL